MTEETERADLLAPLGMLTAVGLAFLVGWCARDNPAASDDSCEKAASTARTISSVAGLPTCCVHHVPSHRCKREHLPQHEVSKASCVVCGSSSMSQASCDSTATRQPGPLAPASCASSDAMRVARRAYCLTLLFNIQGDPAAVFDVTNQTGGGYAAGQIIWCASLTYIMRCKFTGSQNAISTTPRVVLHEGLERSL